MSFFLQLPVSPHLGEGLHRYNPIGCLKGGRLRGFASRRVSAGKGCMGECARGGVGCGWGGGRVVMEWVRNGWSVGWLECQEWRNQGADKGFESWPHTFLGGGANLIISSSEGWRIISFSAMGMEGLEKEGRERKRKKIRHYFKRRE